MRKRQWRPIRLPLTGYRGWNYFFIASINVLLLLVQIAIFVTVWAVLEGMRVVGILIEQRRMKRLSQSRMAEAPSLRVEQTDEGRDATDVPSFGPPVFPSPGPLAKDVE